MTIRTIEADLQAFGERALCATGVPAGDAALVTASMVDADLCGLDEHGAVARLPVYTGRLRAGGIRPATTAAVTADMGAVVALDAHGGLGQVAAHRAMDLAIERARQHGIGLVTVSESNHLGVMGYWSAMAAHRGLIGFALSSAGARIPPWGGSQAALSSNPWSWAFPLGNGRPPLVVDTSSTSVVWMVFAEAQRRGEKIPFGLALDAEGRPTDDPATALRGTTLAFGGAKGGALTLAMEVLSTVVTASAPSTDVPALTELDRQQRLGHVLLALRPDVDAVPGGFQTRLRILVDALEKNPPAAGSDGVRLPGQRRDRSKAERSRHGIPLEPDRHQALDALARELGVEPLSVR